jgi:hypothetical protein
MLRERGVRAKFQLPQSETTEELGRQLVEREHKRTQDLNSGSGLHEQHVQLPPVAIGADGTYQLSAAQLAKMGLHPATGMDSDRLNAGRRFCDTLQLQHSSPTEKRKTH